MAKSVKFTTVEDLVAVFSEVQWQHDAENNVLIFDEKANAWVPVVPGQFVVNIAKRYEVRDEPAPARKTTKKK
jgi:hypothetical protein